MNPAISQTERANGTGNPIPRNSSSGERGCIGSYSHILISYNGALISLLHYE